MDTIADMLTIIRNGQAASKDSVIVPFSSIKYALAKILEKEGYIKKVQKKATDKKKTIKITLDYKDGTQKIQHIGRISTPGQRVYRSKDKLPKVLQGYGIAIISTSKGLMTDRDARKDGLGGEVICRVW